MKDCVSEEAYTGVVCDLRMTSVWRRLQCPKCLKAGLLNSTRKPIETRPQSMLEARELPKCHLSEHIEEHLNRAVQGVSAQPVCRFQC